ncbi:MAG: hypothetical protein ACLTC4_21230 [Hungatella hathewayi]
MFDIVMYEFGTTYNSYVMKTGDKVVLFETAKARFLIIWKIKEVIDVEIDYLVTSHGAGPCGECGGLLDYSPQMKILALPGHWFLKEIVNRDLSALR